MDFLVAFITYPAAEAPVRSNQIQKHKALGEGGEKSKLFPVGRSDRQLLFHFQDAFY